MLLCLWTSKPPPFKSFKNTGPYQGEELTARNPLFWSCDRELAGLMPKPWRTVSRNRNHQVMTSPRALRFKNTCHIGNAPLLPTNTFTTTKKLVFTYQIIDEGPGWRLPFLVTTSRDFQFWMAWPWIVDLIFRTATFRGNGLTPNPTNRWRNVPPENPKANSPVLRRSNARHHMSYKVVWRVRDLGDLCINSLEMVENAQAVTWSTWNGRHPTQLPKNTQLFAQLKTLSNWSSKKKAW